MIGWVRRKPALRPNPRCAAGVAARARRGTAYPADPVALVRRILAVQPPHDHGKDHYESEQDRQYETVQHMAHRLWVLRLLSRCWFEGPPWTMVAAALRT